SGGAKSPKPPLTEENLNQFIAELRKGLPPDSEALKTRATRDWRALLREQFTLTSTQMRALESLPKATVQQVQEAVREAIHTNAVFVVRAVAAEGAAPPHGAARRGGHRPHLLQHRESTRCRMVQARCRGMHQARRDVRVYGESGRGVLRP